MQYAGPEASSENYYAMQYYFLLALLLNIELQLSEGPWIYQH